jgi:HlyD family secretion protein
VPNENNPALDTISRRRPGEREEEGVFLVQNGVATFRPVKVGIAGDEYFEVLDGLRGGETIVAGTYQAIRDLKDGDKVRVAEDTTEAPADRQQAAT